MIRLTELLDESEAGDEARAKGLEYLSFGRYGKGGRVTHIVDPKTHKLVPKPAGEEPAQGSTAAKPAVSRSPDGSRGSKTPLAQEPKGDYGNPDMPTSMPKSTAPQPAGGDMNARRAQYGLGPMPSKITGPGDAPGQETVDQEERIGNALQARDMVVQRMERARQEGDTATIKKYALPFRQLNDKIFAMSKAMDPKTMNPHTKQYLQNRGFIEPDPDPNDPEAWMSDDDAATEFDQGGYYSPKESVIEGRLNELKPKTYKSYQKKAAQNADDSSYLKKRYHDAGTKSRAKGDTIQAKKFGKLSKSHAKNQEKREKGVDNAEDLKNRRTWTTNSGKTATRQADGSVKYSGASHFGPDESVREAIKSLRTESTINELGPKTLKPYVKAAKADRKDQKDNEKAERDYGADDDGLAAQYHKDKAEKRTKGIKSAEKKLKNWTTSSGKKATRSSDGKITYKDK